MNPEELNGTLPGVVWGFRNLNGRDTAHADEKALSV